MHTHTRTHTHTGFNYIGAVAQNSAPRLRIRVVGNFCLPLYFYPRCNFVTLVFGHMIFAFDRHLCVASYIHISYFCVASCTRVYDYIFISVALVFGPIFDYIFISVALVFGPIFDYIFISIALVFDPIFACPIILSYLLLLCSIVHWCVHILVCSILYIFTWGGCD